MQTTVKVLGTQRVLSKLEHLKSTDLIKPLSEVGNYVANQAKENLTANGSVKTGNLRKSITKMVSPGHGYVEVGTNVFYAPHVELGTGVYAAKGGGREGWWVYVTGQYQQVNEDKVVNKKYNWYQANWIRNWLINEKGIPEEDVHITKGSHPKPFLEPALTEHLKEIEDIFKTTLEEELEKDAGL